MDILLEHLDFLIAFAAIAGGYADVRSTVKTSVSRLDKFEQSVLTILQRLEKNDLEDAVREEKIKELAAYRDASSQSKDEALGKLNKIEVLLEAFIEQSKVQHSEYKLRFEKIEEKLYN